MGVIAKSEWRGGEQKKLEFCKVDMPNMSKLQAITIYEDNKAAIQLVSNGMSTSDRSRHIHVRNNFVGQFVENGQIKVVHCPTKHMIADILTKPLGLPNSYISGIIYWGTKYRRRGVSWEIVSR